MRLFYFIPPNNFLLLTSHFLLLTSYFLLLTSYFLLLTSYFLLLTSFAICELRTKPYLYPMRQHNGMRPQDIVILLKLVSLKDQTWQFRDISSGLFIPISEISVSLKRSEKAGLYHSETKTLHRQSLMEFIQYGFKYVFPTLPGTILTGVPTAHSHSFYKSTFKTEQLYVWPFEDGKERGLAIEPLHPNVPKAALKDENLYRLLASMDILRVGKVREQKMAIEELKKNIL
jgi:hypothetical protein